MKDVWRPAVAELVGTFVFCFVGIGAICMNQWTGGQVGLLGIALAHGAALGVMVSALGHVSGGHFNPAVTLAVFMADKLSGRRALAHVLAQLVGATAGAILLQSLVPAGVWEPVQLGTPGFGEGISVLQATVMELVLTFVLVLTVFGTAVDSKGSWSAVAGFGIGTVLVFAVLVAGPMTGAALNPARAFGPAVASGAWGHHLVYWLGPLAGGALASYLYTTSFLGTKPR